MTDQSQLAKAEDEAVDWAVLLADEPENVEQQRAFSRWLDASPANAEAWARARRIYQGLGELPPATQHRWPETAPENDTIDHTTTDHIMGRDRQPRYSSVRRLNRAVLTSIALAACLMLVFIPQLTLHLSADYITGTGEQKTLLLTDGSRLILEPKSAVDITYSGTERGVRLLRGGAFFEVQPDAGRPFHVDAGESRTTVLGTAFSVNKTEDGTVVGVAHGHVKVENRNLPPVISEILTAGDRLAITREQGGSVTRNLTRMEPQEVALWRKGELIARNLTIGEVVESFRRYYRGSIIVTDALANQRVTGLYRFDDPITTLSDMAAAHGATARQISPWLLVLSN